MILAALALVIILLIGYTWMLRGFFSAFLHMICVFAAASIAFAVWEPIAYSLLGQGDLLENSAWALGLGLPFAVALIPIRVIFDKLIPANVKVAPAADYAGGALCGIAAGVVSAGICVLSLGMFRVESEFLGYRALEYSSTGNIVRAGGLMLPADKVVEEVYKYASQRVFSTDTPLAQMYPNLSEVPTAMRMTFGEGKNRNTLKPSDFEVLGRYTVGKGKNLKPTDLLRDKWSPNTQQATDADREQIAQGSYIDGYAIKFNAGAKDRGEGKVVVGAAQMRLVVGDADGYEYRTLYPIAAICQAESATPQLARFRYDGREVFLASAGGAAESIFAFEFVVPQGFEPVALYVKNVRHLVRDESDAVPPPKLGEFPSATERDAAIASSRFIQSEGASGVKDETPLDTSREVKIGDSRPPPPGQLPQVEGILVSNRLRQQLQNGTISGLVLDESLVIIDGRTKVTKEIVSKAQGIEKSLRVEKFSNSADTLIIQLEVSGTTAFSLLGPVASSADQKYAPLLRDTNNVAYLPVGWIYNDASLYDIRYTPGQPIASIDELGREGVGLTRSRTDQKLVLIYRVSKGVTINRFTIGPISVGIFDPVFPLTIDQR
ncbi:MAG: hypothetical protein ACOYN0_18660 [Phycisphaerales bacterium]